MCCPVSLPNQLYTFHFPLHLPQLSLLVITTLVTHVAPSAKMEKKKKSLCVWQSISALCPTNLALAEESHATHASHLIIVSFTYTQACAQRATSSSEGTGNSHLNSLISSFQVSFKVEPTGKRCHITKKHWIMLACIHLQHQFLSAGHKVLC